MKDKSNQKLYHIISIVSLILFLISVVVIIFFGIEQGAFQSEESLELFISNCGIFAPLVFIILAIFAAMIIVIPSTWCFVIGGVLFGTFWGTIINCFASFMASLFMYLLVKKWGKSVLDAFVPQKALDKYYHFLDNEKRFEKLFAFMQIFPFTPDNTFAYIAGTSKMSTKKFCLLVLGFKLWKIVIICVGADYILNILFQIIGF